MVREIDKHGNDADWDREQTKSQPNLETCEQYCLDNQPCFAVSYLEGYCFVYNQPTTPTNRLSATFSSKQCTVNPCELFISN